MAIILNVLTTDGVNASGYLNHLKHGKLAAQGSTSFELRDSGHDVVFTAFGSGFKYFHGFLAGGTVTGFEVEENGVTTIDAQLTPAFKASLSGAFAGYFTNGRYVFIGNDGNDTFKAGHGRDTLHGNNGADHLDGNIGNDRVIGGDGNDTLNGGRGNDVVIGGLGTDSLSGGKNTDKFEFNDITESVAGANRDVIINFHHSQRDRIDLSGIDADTLTDGNQQFSYVHGADFSNVAGELRFADGILQGDVDGDGAADFEVQLLNVNALGNVDLIL
jgi:Ca2+-binding RTX toxin-like protein